MDRLTREEGYRLMREARPKKEVMDTRDRFRDFVGQPLNGAAGYIEIEELGDVQTRREKALPFWKEFFRRIEAFLDEPFDPTPTITTESLRSILHYKDADPMNPDVYHGVKDWFDAI